VPWTADRAAAGRAAPNGPAPSPYEDPPSLPSERSRRAVVGPFDVKGGICVGTCLVSRDVTIPRVAGQAMVQAGSGRRRTTRKPTSQLRSRASRRRRWARAGAARERAAPVVVRQPTATGGLALTQLLDFARLTPAQAVALGADVLSGLHERSASGPTPVGLGPESVRVASDGRAHLIDPPGARNGRDGAPDLAAAGALLGELMAATHASDAAETAAGPLAALGRAARPTRPPAPRHAPSSRG
jgi:hypothetical protein